MRAFRLVKARHAATALDGEGARMAGGRWNAPGIPMAYCASTLSLAVLELLVHVDVEDLPEDLEAIQVEIPEDLPRHRVRVEELPEGWRGDPGRAALQALGSAWARAGSGCILEVPSAVVPSELNVLLNPGHPASHRIRIAGREPFSLDPRLRIVH
jgi:RES domain-containing protein